MTRDTVEFAKALAGQGAIDLIDISTSGVHAAQKVTSGVAVTKGVGMFQHSV